MFRQPDAIITMPPLVYDCFPDTYGSTTYTCMPARRPPPWAHVLRTAPADHLDLVPASGAVGNLPEGIRVMLVDSEPQPTRD
jgi:hypothetical protein